MPPSLPGFDLEAGLGRLQNALEQALDYAARAQPALPKPAADRTAEPSIPTMPPQLARQVSERLREAAEVGNITELESIARELAASYSNLSDRLVQLA